MDKDQKIRLLQFTYAAALAENVYFMGRKGILAQVTAEKREINKKRGINTAKQFGITKPEEVFSTLSEIFGCAQWQVEAKDHSISASSTTCLLCTMAKKLGAPQPCHIYCLDSMAAMIESIAPDKNFIVKSTLWDGEKCMVEVTK